MMSVRNDQGLWDYYKSQDLNSGVNLLSGIDDGKGNRIKINYHRIDSRPGDGGQKTVVASVSKHVYGQSKHLAQYAYGNIVRSKDNGNFLGFDFNEVSTPSIKKKEETVFFKDIAFIKMERQVETNSPDFYKIKGVEV